MSDMYVNLEEKLSRCIRTQNELLRIWFAEFLGTFLLCLIGNGSVHQGMNKTHQYYWKQNPEDGPLMVLSWIMFPGSPDKNSFQKALSLEIRALYRLHMVSQLCSAFIPACQFLMVILTQQFH